MSATVLQLPGTREVIAEAPGLNLSAQELVDASGGYRRPAEQLKALHARGFVRAWRRDSGRGPVILERAHYDAVVRGQFGQQQAANEPAARAALPPNRAGYKARFKAEKPGA